MSGRSPLAGRSDYAMRMTPIGLPARIAYAVGAFPVAAGSCFYLTAPLFLKYVLPYDTLEPGMDGYRAFVLALATGLALGFTAFLFALTLPRIRSRTRRGRPLRAGLSAAFVLVATLTVASQTHAVMYDLGMAVWLALTLTVTFVRYGVADPVRRASGAEETPTPVRAS